MSKANFVLVILVPLFVACQVEPMRVSEPTADEKLSVRGIGVPATDLLLKTLQRELLSAIGHYGIEGALEVCNQRALFLTDSITLSSERIIGIKRTTVKFRNPQNAPDAAERLALDYFADRITKGEALPQDLVQTVTDSAGTHFRYYKPLTVKPLCLNCHGAKGNIDVQVKNTIKQFYPQDLAVDYNVDDFRGVVRVSVK
ncbi:MAG: DUF3365 domain-containing protein [Calditrichales bacterium]|nr:MAG: DUF3365 domain-containing protein [Calditrichales bacterium]